MKVGDLVKMEGGTLRPPWYGEPGVVLSDVCDSPYETSSHLWYRVALTSSGAKMIRADMLVVLNESR